MRLNAACVAQCGVSARLVGSSRDETPMKQITIACKIEIDTYRDDICRIRVSMKRNYLRQLKTIIIFSTINAIYMRHD